MVRSGMPARDIFVRQVRRIEWLEAPSMPIDSKASLRMLWARTLFMCSSGSSEEGKSQGDGVPRSSRWSRVFL